MTEDRKVWSLGSASKYRDRPNQGTFSPPELVSWHMFGWEHEHSGFLLLDTLGLAGDVHHRLPMPVTLAETFLRKCLEPNFRETFLTCYLSKDDASDIIEADGTRLTLNRGKSYITNAFRSHMPGLSLRVEGKVGPPQDVHLFYELRKMFGAYVAGLSADMIRKKLYAT